MKRLLAILRSRELILSLANTGVVMVGTFLSLKLFSNLLPVAEYGRLALALVVAGSIQTFFAALYNSVLRYFPIARAKGELAQYAIGLNRLQRWSVVIPVVAGVVLMAATMLDLLTFDPVYPLAILLAVATGWTGWGQGMLLAMRARGEMVLISSGMYLARPLLAALALYFFGADALWALCGLVLVQSIMCVLSSWRSRARTQQIAQFTWGEGTDSGGYEFTLLRYSGYFLTTAIFAAIVLQGDRWVIDANLTAYDLGIYSAMFVIASALAATLQHAITQLMIPIVFQRAGLNSTKETASAMQAARLTWLISAVGYSFALSMTYLLQEPLIRLLTNPEFLVGSGLLPILLAALAVERIGQNLTLQGFIRLVTWPYLVTRIAHASTMLSLSLLWVGDYGMYGVAYAQLAGAVVYLISTLFINKISRSEPAN